MERTGRAVEVMVCSYNQSKSNDISRSLRDLFNHPDFNKIFPATRLKEGNADVEQVSRPIIIQEDLIVPKVSARMLTHG